MKKINIKLLEHQYKKYHKSIYIINQDVYTINNKIFKIRRSTSNLSSYLNSIGSSLKNLILHSIDDNKCKQCGNNTKILFSRNKITKFHFCSTVCQQIYKRLNKERICPVCYSSFLHKDSNNGTCGNESCVNEYRLFINKKIKNNHWCNTIERDDIIKKKKEKRIKNDKKYNRTYTPWNKGKTGIYSKETIEKIRNATLKQLEKQIFKKTKIEIKIEEYLKSNNINYKYSFILNKRQYDFLLIDYDIIIEADGDYWHGNTRIYKNLTDRQILKKKDDLIKNQIASTNNYIILRFWEFDIHNNFNIVITKIKEKINEQIVFKNIKNNS